MRWHMPTQWPWRVSHGSLRAAAVTMGMCLDVLLASPQCCTRMEAGFIAMIVPSGSGTMGRWHDCLLSPWHATDPVLLVLVAAQTRATHPGPHVTTCIMMGTHPLLSASSCLCHLTCSQAVIHPPCLGAAPCLIPRPSSILGYAQWQWVNRRARGQLEGQEGGRRVGK